MNWQSAGMRSSFRGRIRTVKCYESNALVRQVLESKGEGCVLVVDGGGSKRCALIGDNLASLASNNNWRGVLVYGCIRDRKTINEIDVGLKFLDTCPRKGGKVMHAGEVDIPVTFGGVTFKPGHYLISDEDGVIVSETDEVSGKYFY